jgi:hypothetical protein
VAQARFSELDRVLVAVRNRHVDECVRIFARRLDVRRRCRTAAEGGVQPAARLPRETERRARCCILQMRQHAPQGGNAGDPVDEDDRRQDVVRVGEVDTRKDFGQLRYQPLRVAADIDEPDDRREVGKLAKRTTATLVMASRGPITRSAARQLVGNS